MMNEEVLDKYTEAWQLGDMRPYLSILVGLENFENLKISEKNTFFHFQHPSYTLSGVSPTPVPRDEIYEFVIKFRKQVVI